MSKGDRAMSKQERLARAFHEAYERLAPSFGYETRRDSAVPWEDVPEPNRSLMIAVAGEVLARPAGTRPQMTTLVCTCSTAEDRRDYPHAEDCALMARRPSPLFDALRRIYTDRDLFGGDLARIDRAVEQDVPDLLGALLDRDDPDLTEPKERPNPTLAHNDLDWLYTVTQGRFAVSDLMASEQTHATEVRPDGDAEASRAFEAVRREVLGLRSTALTKERAHSAIHGAAAFNGWSARIAALDEVLAAIDEIEEMTDD